MKYDDMVLCHFPYVDDGKKIIDENLYNNWHVKSSDTCLCYIFTSTESDSHQGSWNKYNSLGSLICLEYSFSQNNKDFDLSGR